MKFCLRKPSIWGQRGSVNLPNLTDSDSQTNRNHQNGNPREPIVVSYKHSSEMDSTALTVNMKTGVSEDKKKDKKSSVNNGDQQVAKMNAIHPRGGIIGKTPTPTSEPTPIYEKDERSIHQIKDAILKNEFLSNLDEKQINILAMAMYSKEIRPGTTVIREGDIGSHLYVSAEGEFDIYHQGSTYQNSFGAGVAFGELALLYNTKRLRTISVKKSAKVWVLDRSVFLAVMMRSAEERLDANIRFLRQVPQLQNIPEPKDHVLAKISDLIRVEFYPAGARIVQQGEKGDKFFIISGGSVRISKYTDYGGEEELIILGKGQCFGEIALYDDQGEKRRQANVTAIVPVECLTLDRTSFHNYLGSLDEIKNKNWLAEYERQKRSLTPRLFINEYSDIRLSDLVVKSTLGVGGFGRVELVTLRSDPEKSFALKKLKKKVMVEQQQQEHVLNEKNIMQACSSPFICKLYRTYKDSKHVYFLMEVCLGGDVWTALQRKRCFSETTTQFMVGCVIEALDHLHTLNIVYRDLKPENLMLDSKGYLKLVDFGFSKKIGPLKTWTFAGTPEYVAPEIILNKSHDRAVDYWALGILIHELLIGKPPFRGVDHMTTYNKILKGIEIVGIQNSINKTASNLIKKLLRSNPSERLGYQRNGIQDIRDHKWFLNFNWKALQQLTMPAPIIPIVTSHTDTRNFEKYPNDNDDPPDEYSGWDMSF